jgi:Protein of unknown function (DUF3570)
MRFPGLAVAAAWMLASFLPAGGSGNANFDIMHYRDADGMRVTTSETGLEKALAPGWLWSARLLWDRIAVEPGDSGSAGAGHEHHLMKGAAGLHDGEPHEEVTGATSEVDGTSGASQRASAAGGGAVQHRYQVEMGLARQIGHGSTPHRLGGKAAVSYEDDYVSATGVGDASIEIFQRNVTLSGYAGFGYDRIEPVVPPPGEGDRWPATQTRYLMGFGYSQVTGRRSTVSLGYGLQVQAGTLESPYRRALVITTQFAENLPDLRVRQHAALSWSYTPIRNVALHHREGIYYDSWNYHAWIPETALSWQFLSEWMVTVRHRFVSQDAAEFWQHHYTSLAGYRSGDFRLAGLRHQAGTAQLAWRHFVGFRVLELSGHATAFHQSSRASGVHSEGMVFGLSGAWAW